MKANDEQLSKAKAFKVPREPRSHEYKRMAALICRSAGIRVVKLSIRCWEQSDLWWLTSDVAKNEKNVTAR